MRLLVLIAFLSPMISAVQAQSWIHPLAERSGATLTYGMNAEKDIMPQSFDVELKRTASPIHQTDRYAVKDHYADGTLQFEGQMHDPDPITVNYYGDWVTFYPNGDTNEFVQQESIKRNGRYLKFHEEGGVSKEGEYLDDKKVGVWLSYHSNGQMKDSGAYAQSEKSGFWRYFDKEGRVSYTDYYDSDGEIQRRMEYHENGTLKVTYHYVDGKRQGEVKGYYDSGQLNFHEFHKGGERTGHWKTFFKDGTIESSSHYQNDDPVGKYFVLNDERDTIASGEFIDGDYVGEVREFDKSGVLRSESEYLENGEVSSIFYTEDGVFDIKRVWSEGGIQCFDAQGTEISCGNTEKTFPKTEVNFYNALKKLDLEKVDDYYPRGVYEFSVNTDGSVEAKVIDATNKDYDQAVIDMLTSTEFEPGFYEGREARYTNEMAVKFYKNPIPNLGQYFLDDSTRTQREALEVSVPSSRFVTIVEENPEYPNGEQGLFSFLGSNLNYPAEAKDRGIQGIVYSQFVVGRSGVVRDISMLRSVYPVLDYEARRVIEEMPNWLPGKQRGIPVNVYYKLPFRFKLR